MEFLRDWLSIAWVVRVLVFAGWAIAGFAAVPNGEINAPPQLPLNPIFEGFSLRPLFPGLVFDNPVAVTTPPGETNRLFVVERKGRIMVVTNLSAPDKTVFLDLTGSVHSDYLEAGLLGLAFHPGYATNGSFFVFRTRLTTTEGITNALHDELSRFEVSPTDPHRANPASEKRVWAEYDASVEHNGGDLHFGPDGYLYVSLGNGPDPATWAARQQPIDQGFFEGIIRIDVDHRPGNLPPNPHPGISDQYLVPHDNPFVGATSSGGATVDPTRVRTEYYAIGLRNPWRMSFDTMTGTLYCGDVGAGQLEEIDVIERGGNYGWPYLEATNVTDLRGQAPVGFQSSSPLYSYLHGRGTNEGSAVVGGVVYRGFAVPELYGAYIFGDNPSGHIWALRHEGQAVENVQPLTSEPGVSAFATDPRNGDVLVVNHTSGVIKRLAFVAAGSVPPFPDTLAATGLFADVTTLSPAPGVRPYSVNVPFWSDGTSKSRWFWLPNGQSITFSTNASWLFPAGMIWVKHFELRLTNNAVQSTRRLETRVLVKNDEGVYGVTYRWGDSMTNASLVPENGMNETFVVQDGGMNRTQVWNYLARHECLVCHTPSAGYALGFGTAQLNRSCDSPGCVGNQIQALSDQGCFTSSIPDVRSLRALAHATNSSYPLEYRVRSYWAANCSQCHNPSGVDTVAWDARVTVPISAAKVIDVIPAFNLGAVGTLDNGVVVVGPGSPENRIIKPNAPSNSVLLTRISTPIGVRMPPLGSAVLDHGSIQLVSNWIQSLPPFPWDHLDLPESGLEGSASIDNNLYRVAASSGSSGSGRALDAGHYLHVLLWANGQITARVTGGKSSLESSPGLAGVMVREDLKSFSPAAALWLKTDGGATFERRLQAGQNISSVSSPGSPAVSWIRLIREADQVRALASADGTNWVLLAQETVDFSKRARIGLAAMAPGPARFYEATFDEVSVVQVGLTNPVPGAVFVQPTTIPLKAQVEALGRPVESVEFYAGTNRLGRSTVPPYTLDWTNPPSGFHSLVARAIDSRGSSIASVAVPIQVNGPVPNAFLIKSNATTKGVWKNQFGEDGAIIVGDSTNLPSYAEVNVSAARTTVWSPATVDARALERVRGLLRVAAAWEADREFSIDVNLVDGRLHRLALYFLDWDSNAANLRSQSVEVVDAGTGTVLDRQTLSNFSGGVYLVWRLRGRVQIRVTSASARTVVVSGLFLEPDDNHPPEVRLISPSPDAVLRLPVGVSLTAEATDPDGEISRVEFFVDGSVVGEATEEPFLVKWKNILAGRHVLHARAFDNLAEPRLSDPIEITIEPAWPQAQFVGIDSTTHGRWKGRYGMEGYLIVNHATNLPAYATVAATNVNDVTYAEWSLRDVALKHIEDNFGIEAGWVPNNQTYVEFSVHVRLLDATNHLVSFYIMDFDTPARVERIDLLGTEGEILDSQEASLFTEGKYFTWSVRGPVTARFKSVRGLSTASGIFFDRPLTAFQAWLELHFSEIERSSAEMSGPNADPDGDGLDNQTEYILGLNPREADAQLRPSLQMVDGHAVFTYTRGTASSGVALFIEWSDDLVHWGDAEAIFETVSSVVEGPVQRVTLRSREPLPGASVGFLRTRVVGSATD
jgi:glucose/arabinose dehydrogenase/regulation of enolase protein 1 (concanavalin A-like superfamily)